MVILIPVSVFFSCCTNEGVELFRVQTETDYTIQGGLNQIQTHFFINNQVPTFWSTFSAGLEDSAGEILPNRATLSSRFGENLGHISSVSIWVYDVDFEEGTEIFFMEPVQFGDKTEIQLFSNLDEVSQWITEERVLIEMRLTFRQIIGAPRDVRLSMDFVVFEKE